MAKWKFIEDQLMSNSIQAAFQRANVYREEVAETDVRRETLRKSLANLLRRLATQYAVAVPADRHEQNIQKIADDLSSQFSNERLLANDRFRLGVAHKALNLYLKYLWCLGKIPTPPHCPFDDEIIAKLPLTDQQKKDLRWTKLDSLDGYRSLVNAAMEKIEQTGHGSLSDWELEEWGS